MEKTKKITQDIQPILDEYQVDLYEINWIKSKRNSILQIAIMNKDKTMDIDTCASVSEKISSYLDESNLIDDEYMLEVCSPGAERALRNLNEIKDAINQKVFVSFKKDIKGLNEVIGNLIQVEENLITVKYMDKAVAKNCQIEFENIKLIRLAV